MGYEVRMQEDILALLLLFRGRVPDGETNDLVTELATDRNRWPGAHDLFRQIRRRSLEAAKRQDSVRCAQYVFEELCLKSLYNETNTRYPFDPSSPYFVAGFAIQLARKIGVPVEDVLAIVAPDRADTSR